MIRFFTVLDSIIASLAVVALTSGRPAILTAQPIIVTSGRDNPRRRLPSPGR